MGTKSNKSHRIAVVGFSTIFPGSTDNPGFWRNIINGRDFVTEVPQDHWLAQDYYEPLPTDECKTYSNRGGFIPDVAFDPAGLGIPPKLLSSIDNVQLLSLHAAQRLLGEVRSINNGRLDRKDVSVIIGVAAGTELIEQMSGKLQRPIWVKVLREHGLSENKIQSIADSIEGHYPEWTEDTFPGLLANVTAGRITNRLDIHGTNCVIDAACASSLAALSMGINELSLGTTDMVIGGGADVLNGPLMYICFSKTPALSPTGDCRPFSDNADGTILGEGVGLFALRRLEDAERDGDAIYAVINSIGTSSDGNAKSIYAPSSPGQALAIQRAYDKVDYSPAEVELVEAHGTGTSAGDAAEFEGLLAGFGSSGITKKQFCALGSIKSQIGHTKAAAGAAGLFKTIMALHQKVLPPTIKVDRPNPDLAFKDSPFYINTSARPWIHDANSTRKASLSSFGFGGSNYHLAIEEYNGSGNRPGRVRHAPEELLLIGADELPELLGGMDTLMQELARVPLELLARKSQLSFDPRKEMRLGIIASDAQKVAKLADICNSKIKSEPCEAFSLPFQAHYESGCEDGKVAFLFAGQGSQYPGMGADLAMEFSECREIWEEAARCFRDEHMLHDVVFPKPAFTPEENKQQEDLLTQTRWTQPAIGAVSLSHLALLKRAGIIADCTAGHSYGEIPALFAAGAIGSLEDLLAASHKRGVFIQNASSAGGTMTAVMHPVEELQALVDGWDNGIVIANHNSPSQSVLSGPVESIEEAERALSGLQIPFNRLQVATAFHSPVVSSCVGPFREYLSTVEFAGPKIPVYSNTSAKPYPPQPEKIRDLLANQLSRPVLFKDQIRRLYEDEGVRVFIEIGPGTVLSRLTDKCLEGKPHISVPIDGGRNGNGVTSFWNALGRLAVSGRAIEFKALWDGFECAQESVTSRNTTVNLNGSKYGKIYPPRAGAAGLPQPNPENEKQPRPAVDSGLHKQIAEAQQSFQQTLKESHLAFLKASETAFRQLAALGDVAGEQPQPGVSTPTPPIQGSNPLPTQEAPQTTVSSNGDFKSALMKVVSEKTGYPVEMLQLDMDLESALGIDSIKKVEIFSALRKEFAELTTVEMSQIAKLRTLGEILSLAESDDADKSTQVFSGAHASNDNSDPGNICRYVFRDRLAPAPSKPMAGLTSKANIYITSDTRNVAPLLAGKFQAMGIGAEVVTNIPENADAVIFTKGIDSDIRSPLSFNREAFATARNMARLPEDRKRLLVTVQDSSGGSGPWCSGLAALAMTARIEWPDATVKSIDIECVDRESEIIAQAIFDEITDGGPEPGVSLKADGRRFVSEILPAETDGGSKPPSDGEVVIVSGGARGITASCLKSLADAVKVRIAIFGRSVPIKESSSIAVCETSAELIRTLAAEAEKEGEMLTPLQCERKARIVLASRELKKTISDLEGKGIEVKYFPLDICNADALNEAIGQVRSEWGDVGVLIHGAGVISDKYLKDKTDEQFDKVFKTKVMGFENLLEATRDDNLTHVCCFSSIVARNGNAGQSDYAMANAVLNAICLREKARRNGMVAVKSIGWGPWEGGMVGPELQSLFLSKGIGLIPLNAGARAFTDEMFNADDSVEVIISGNKL